VTSLFDRYQRIAPFYDLLDSPFEHGRYRRIRPELFRELSGRILDAGVGTGRNIAYYPPGAEMVGIDLSYRMIGRADRRADRLGRKIELHQMDVTRLAFPAGSFDAAVASFLFCVLPDAMQEPALNEIRRVVKPGGEVRLLEYVQPTGPFRAFIARLWAPWMHWAYGAGFDRNTEQHAVAAGFKVMESRYVVPDLLKVMSLRA
jgi:ubiquinone/menaquinone biosynthesis C-methylase UbiE